MTSRKKRWVLVTMVLLIVGGGVYLLGERWQRYSDYRAAQDALARRDFREASRRLHRHLQQSKDLDALLLAAQVARRQGKFQEAFSHLEEYRRQMGPADPFALEHALLRMQQGDLTEADEHVALCDAQPESAAAGHWKRAKDTES